MKILGYTLLVISLLIIGIFAGCFLERTGTTFTQAFAPKIMMDGKARAPIEEMGVHLPEAANTLYYCLVGFEEPSVWIGMNLPSEEREALIDKWLKVPHKTLTPCSTNELNMLLNLPAPTDLWNYTIMKKPVCYRHMTEPETISGTVIYNCETTVIYDEAGERVLLYYWHE